MLNYSRLNSKPKNSSNNSILKVPLCTLTPTCRVFAFLLGPTHEYVEPLGQKCLHFNQLLSCTTVQNCKIVPKCNCSAISVCETTQESWPTAVHCWSKSRVSRVKHIRYAQPPAQYALQQSNLAHSAGGSINRWSNISLLLKHSCSS